MLPTTAPSLLDLQAFGDLRRQAASDDPRALAEAAVQFEALFIGMMLKTAREASLGEGIFDSAQSLQYLELMDQQIALDLARNGGFGIGKMLIEQIGGLDPASADAARVSALLSPARRIGTDAGLSAPQTSERGAGVDDAPPSPQAFVERLWPEAASAAQRLGVEPRLLLAQAALETGWGASLPRHADGRPTHNLFGIKATGAWAGAKAAHWTVENVGGIAERRREEFRAYGAPAESFADYVDLVSSSPRYAEALEHAGDAERYARSLAAAGYATDPQYADKWLDIYHGDRLTTALDGLKHSLDEPTQ